jgi:hypothetical protein
MRTGLVALTMACFCVVSQCSTPGQFYLIYGPLASETPQEYSAAFKGDLNHPESISAVLAYGEGFEGRWTSTRTRTGKTRFQDTPIPPQPELRQAWDTIYGEGFFIAHVLGARFFERAVLTGSKGTVLQVEIYRRPHDTDLDPRLAVPLDIQGVAQDDKGDIYKIIFQ